MKNKIKKWHIALMSFLTLFIAIFASLFNLRADTVDDETGEVLTDNWELGVVFYDSTVDNGTTPLTEINWDASDGSYGTGESRVITVQINYENTNILKTYQVGELEISIPNLIYNTYSSAQWTATVTVGANDSTHTGYAWNFNSAQNAQNYIFKNANIIEAETNFEGSIQIVYNITPLGESDTDSPYIEEYDDECTHAYSTNLKASLFYSEINENSETENVQIDSNELSINYTRTYVHKWRKIGHSIVKSATTISAKDGINLNTDEYYFVKFNFDFRENPWNMYGFPFLYAKNRVIRDAFPEECLVYDEDFNLLTGIEQEDGNILYEISAREHVPSINEMNYDNIFYVAYPKNIFNEENNNLIITNTGYVYGIYETETEESLLAQDDITINLAEFNFSYPDQLYGLSKLMNDSGYAVNDTVSYLYYEALTGQYQNIGTSGTTVASIYPVVYYTNKPLDVIIGDDLLYITDTNSNYRKLNESEYYFSTITFNNIMQNALRETIAANKYNCELWIKYNTDETYTKYADFTNQTQTWTFTSEQHVTAYYFVIRNMEESILNSLNRGGDYRVAEAVVTINNATNIAETGTIYNFAYLQVLMDDIVQNTPSLENYSNFITQQEISQYDLNTYGSYMQRACDSVTYSTYSVPLRNSMRVSNTMSNITQDAANEMFTGSADAYYVFQQNDGYRDEAFTYPDLVNDESLYTGIELYAILPQGMILTSSKTDIINALEFKSFSDITAMDQTGYFYSSDELKNFFLNHTELEIIHNYNNTGKTKIALNIDFESTPLIIIAEYSMNTAGIYLHYNYEIPYDSYLEFGATWRIYAYAKPSGKDIKGYSQYDQTSPFYTFSSITSDSMDLNNNNNTSEKMIYQSVSKSITSVISTHQDVTTFVETDKNNYSTGIVYSSENSNYTYKLRARTGAADVTNLIIYCNIEEAYGNNDYWKGEFLDIDTSYAINQGYVIKTWYSEKTNAGTLADDSTWTEYTSSTDKTKVKSLAFQYLDSEGKAAILPANNLTYVLLKMKAPVAPDEVKYAYNQCWTQWNALDEFDQPVDFITGITSNTTQVIINTYFDITVDKIWVDENNKWNLRPDSVDIILKKDDIEIDRRQITSDCLTVTFSNLEAMNLNSYSIEEEPLKAYLTPTISLNSSTGHYEITNILDTIDISGIKTWENDIPSQRPETITIKLLQNDVEVDSIITSAEQNWEYYFNSVAKYDSDGNEYTYSIKENPVEKYVFSHKTIPNGVQITFNSNFKTESVNYDYVEIYYILEGTTYKLGRWGGTSLAGQTVQVPTNDFYLYWRTDGSSCSYYGFSIDSIIPISMDIPANQTTGTLPSYTVAEISGDTYPDSAFGSYAHGNYGNNVNKLWHYSAEIDGVYDIINTRHTVNIISTKTWKNDTADQRPEFITIKLLQDGTEYATTITSADNNWEYSFLDIPEFRSDGTLYEYSVQEVPVDGYTTKYGIDANGVIVTFNNQSQTEKVNYDWVDIFYKLDGTTYNLGRWGGTALAGLIVEIPSKDFYLYWHTDSSVNSYYGFSIDSIVPANVEHLSTTSTATLPSYTVEEISGTTYPESPHSPYENSTDKLWHYTCTDITYSDTPQVGVYQIVNIYEKNNEFAIKFTKSIFNRSNSDATAEDFDKLALDINDTFKFKISLRNVDTGAVYQGILDSKTGLTFSGLEIGTYEIFETDSNYFDLRSMIKENTPEGVVLSEVNNVYTLIVTEDIDDNTVVEINVINILEPDRFFEYDANRENLFLINKNELDPDEPQE